MELRELIALLGGEALARPLPARATGNEAGRGGAHNAA